MSKGQRSTSRARVIGTGKTPGNIPLDQVRLIGVVADVTATVRSCLRPSVAGSNNSGPGLTMRSATSSATPPTSATTRSLTVVNQRGARTDSGAAALGVGSLPSGWVVVTACSSALLTSVLMTRNGTSPLGR